MNLKPKNVDRKAINIEELTNDNNIKVIVIEPDGKAMCFALPEHGETTIVTARGKGYKVKHNIEFLMNQG